MHNALIRNATISAVLLTAFCGATYAGNNNTIVIKQENTLGIGNSLTVDQFHANGSTIGGASLELNNTLSLSTTAQQIGGGNTANLIIKDSDGFSGGKIGLLQDNRNTALTIGPNNATVSVLGGGLALVSQIGGGNIANLEVHGSSTNGSIYQDGNGNNAGLNVFGTDASGSITQIGNNTNIGLLVSGQGTNASYTLIGSNVANPVTGGAGVQVISNGATVTITQTPF